MSAILRLAEELGVPVVARGSGTGLSGGAVPTPDAVVVSFAGMNEILEIDTENHVAVVQPGVTLEALDRCSSSGCPWSPVGAEPGSLAVLSRRRSPSSSASPA